MDATATSGCSMTSVSLTLSRRDTERSLEGTSKGGEEVARFIALPQADTILTIARLDNTYFQHNKHNHSPQASVTQSAVDFQTHVT
jgi:hypothetical protein